MQGEAAIRLEELPASAATQEADIPAIAPSTQLKNVTEVVLSGIPAEVRRRNK